MSFIGFVGKFYSHLQEKSQEAFMYVVHYTKSILSKILELLFFFVANKTTGKGVYSNC